MQGRVGGILEYTVMIIRNISSQLTVVFVAADNDGGDDDDDDDDDDDMVRWSLVMNIG